jgi:hypothetical protein
MSNPVSRPQPGPQALRRGSWYDPTMRVGDAERGDVVDRLAQHYSDGRLDHAEFSERLDRAMAARTMADLAGLLSDLPDGEPVRAQLAGGRRHQRQVLKLQLEHRRLELKRQRHEQRRAERRQRLHAMRWLPLLAAVVIAAIVVIHTLTHSFAVWVLLAVAAFLWLRRNAGGQGSGGG